MLPILQRGRGAAAPILSPMESAASREPTLWDEDVLDVDGTTLAMFTSGPRDGPLLVMFHGLGHWAVGCWSALARELADEYRMIAFDLPGFGSSDKPDAPYDLDYFTSVCHGALTRVAPHGKATLLGHSLGGLIAASIAAEHATLVRSLVLISSAGFKIARPWTIAFMGNKLTAPMFSIQPSRWFVRRTLIRTVYDPRTIDPEQFEVAYAALADPRVRRTFSRVYSAAIHEIGDFSRIREIVSRYRGSVLGIFGSHDPYIPIDVADAVQTAYPHARVEIFGKCGHCAQIEYPAEVARLVREFVPAGTK